MNFFFETIKAVFVFLSICVAIFFVRGQVVFGPETFVLVKQFIMPGYLVFCGLIVGYIVANIQIANTEDEHKKNSIFSKAFIIGILVGLILAISYIFI